VIGVPAGPLEKSKEDLMSLVPFDDRDGFIWYNRLVPWHDAKLHLLTHLQLPTISALRSLTA
jgi:hypothetical protein